MSINARTDDLIPLKSVIRLLRRNITYQTLQAWIHLGCINRSTGKVVFLESVKLGGRRFTTAQALDRFFEEVSSDD